MPTAVVVDDSPIMRKALKSLLQDAGCEIVGEGNTGDDVLPLYERLQPDLMTVDIVMPGTDGVTAAEMLLSKHPEASVVMCTSLTSRDTVLRCQRAGVRHFIIKPFDRERVLRITRTVLARVEPARAGAAL